MIKTINIKVSPKTSANIADIKLHISNKYQIPLLDIGELRITKRSIDARTKNIIFNLDVTFAYKDSKELPKQEITFKKQDVSKAPKVHIIGFGPAGMFAALTLIENGLRPIILERGKDVSNRKKDIARINQNIAVDENSNYCFGEGGAGTFSDGKLYTRSKKKGNNTRVLELLVLHGAKDSILIDSHPHIGTDKLPKIMSNIRETIIECGGKVYFETCVKGFTTKDNKITQLITSDEKIIETNKVIIATGHSARDIYYGLHESGIQIEAKPFAMGVRAEHPQELINTIQYHGVKNDYLPAASYNLVKQVNERGVYSFCMCPGGIIVPASTAKNECVVNGMSNSERNSPFANSGIAVEIRLEDMKDFEEYGPLAGLKLQEHLESLAFENGGQNQIAPAQAIADFVAGRKSKQLPKCSYIPGLVSSEMHKWLPKHFAKRLQIAFKEFDKKMPGYCSNKGIIVGVESRTSSPVRIPRNKETFQHITIQNLYPCGEGSGYAGGIVSSAVDGMVCANAIIN